MEFKKKDNIKKYKKKAMAAAWNNESDSKHLKHKESQAFVKACKTLIDSGIPLCAFEENFTSRSNFLRGSIPSFLTILQNPTLLDSMVASGSSDSVGGYSATFLTVDQLEHFSAVKIKLCGNKILVPRSDTFSSCTKGDANMMFWAIQKQEINMAQDRKNKLAVSLPYAPPALERRIEDIAPEYIVPVGETTEEVIPPIVPAPPIVKESVAEGAAHTEGEHVDIHIEETPSVPKMEITMEESHDDSIPEVVAPGHTKDVQMENASAQGEPEIQREPDIQGEPAATAPADQFQEGLVESISDEDVEPAVDSGGKGKGVVLGIPLLTRKAHHRSKKKRIQVHLEPSIARLNAQGEILCSLQSDVTSIFLSQSTEAKDIRAVKSELLGMRCELGSLKKLVTDLSDFVRVHLSALAPPAPTQPVPEVSSGPSELVETVAELSGPSVEESGPPGPIVEEFGPSGPSAIESRPPGTSLEESRPCVAEDVSVGPSRPSKQVESMAGPTGPQTPAPSSAPKSFTAPLAPEPSKKPLPKHLSSPTPFPTSSSSSPIPSPSIPHTTSEAPPASSSAGPSSAGPSTQPPPTSSFASLHPPTPPSFITIIPEGTSVVRHTMQDIKDEFEEAILRTLEHRFHCYIDFVSLKHRFRFT
ncbi:hypothetical protein Taro_036611 [Colocasia esculenta]|uniref:Uncharacterized protein n=1 Tax=Colocasia esculenta TaxID=4460 RepID=A0A843VY09_COLES|nr:hypothetical protein [Colocasia esculenta]